MNKFSLKFVEANDLVVYTKLGCSYCDKAKELLDKKGVSYIPLKVVTPGQVSRIKMMLNKNEFTYPVIFFEGEYIGGYDDLKKELK